MTAPRGRQPPTNQSSVMWSARSRYQPPATQPPYAFACASATYAAPPMARLRLTATFPQEGSLGPNLMPDLSRVRGLAGVVRPLEPAKQLSALRFCTHEGIDAVCMIVWAGAVECFLAATGIRPGTVAARFVHQALLAAAHIRPNHGLNHGPDHGPCPALYADCDGPVPCSPLETRYLTFSGSQPLPPSPTSVMWSARPAAANAPFTHRPCASPASVPKAPHGAPACQEKQAGAGGSKSACEEEAPTATTGPSVNDGSRRRCRRGRRGAGARGYSE
jgi:hypothetical protein